ncbi:MAG: hypothetical protein K9M07_04545 [Simkaniaceae bacterium]|nr:hypothetical protein [Simkaniaceae bacterium]
MNRFLIVIFTSLCFSQINTCAAFPSGDGLADAEAYGDYLKEKRDTEIKAKANEKKKDDKSKKDKESCDKEDEE